MRPPVTGDHRAAGGNGLGCTQEEGLGECGHEEEVAVGQDLLHLIARQLTGQLQVDAQVGREIRAAIGQGTATHPGQPGRNPLLRQRRNRFYGQVRALALDEPPDADDPQRVTTQLDAAARCRLLRHGDLVGDRQNLALGAVGPQVGGELVGDGGDDVGPALQAQNHLSPRLCQGAELGAALGDPRPVLRVEPRLTGPAQGVGQEGGDRVGVDDVAAVSQRRQLLPGRKHLVGPRQRHGQAHHGQPHHPVVAHPVVDGGRGEVDDTNVVTGRRHGGGVACHEDPQTR